MGMSRFSDGKFDLVVIADHPLDDDGKADLRAELVTASEALFDATEGQLRFGSIYIGDDNFGLGAAEMVMHDVQGRAFATIGGYGTPGQRMHLFANSDGKTIVHEFGHHAFALYDEYTREVLVDRIDREATPPVEYSQDPPLYNDVPLIASELPSQDLDFADAVIRFGSQLRAMIVQAHAPTLLNCFGDFGSNPMTESNGFVVYQRRDVGCATDANAIHSIMDGSDQPQVTEFCTAANHNLARFDDPPRENAHSAVYGGLSCWEVMRDQMLNRWDYPLAIPDPEAASGPDISQSLTYDPPLFFDLVKEGRFVLVMDRSGSMAEDGKIVGARYGVEVWLQVMAQLGDFLSVIWYDENIDVRLPLSDVTDATDLEALIDTTNSVVPQGYTNIRDALYEAHQQITSREGRAAIQGVILLTDGIHNRPIDTSPLEVVPTFQADGIPILGIALGDPENVDFETLETLCKETGGVLQAVSAAPGYDSSDENTIRGAAGFQIGQAHGLLRNGVTVFGDLEIGSEDDVAAAMSKPGKSSAKLKKLAHTLGLKDSDDLLRRRQAAGAAVVRFHVEKGAEYAVFTAVYREKEDLEIVLVDPGGNVVEYDDNECILVESTSPLKLAIVKKPEPGIWKAVLSRKTTGPSFKVFYYAEVENRRIAVHGMVDPLVGVGQTAVIRASGNWKDLLSDLHVSARIKDPQGGLHTVTLSDAQHAEPNSGEYVGTFVPEMPGRYSVELTIANRGRAVLAGGVHRLLHGPAPDRKKPQVIDISSDAPVFVRRIPLYFDAGKRPLPVDNDDRSGGRIHFPVRPRKTKLKPLNIQRVLKRAERGKATPKASVAKKSKRS